MSSKTIGKVAGFVIGAVLVAVGIATGNVGLIIQGGALIVLQGIVDLTMPHAPARQASEMTIALGEQPRVMMVGEAFTPGSLVDGFDYGGKYGTDWEVLIIRLADHKCHSLTGFYVNDEYNIYTGDGPVARYKSKLEIYFRSDTTNQTIASVVTSHGPGWTADDVGESGCDVVVAYKADKPDAKHPVWPGGRPRFGFVLKGKLCYDPRLDSTVTGGSGSHRWDDPDTWEWSENAAVVRYNWVRGVYANDDVTDQPKLLVGRGLTAEEAPPENIFAAANLCDDIAAAVLPIVPTTGGGSPGDIALSPDGGRLYVPTLTGVYVYDAWTQSQIVAYDAGVSLGSPIGVGETSLYAYNGDILTSPLDGMGWTVLGHIPVIAGYSGIQVLGGTPYITGTAGAKPAYWDGATFQIIGSTFYGNLHYFQDLDLNVWAAGNVSGALMVNCLSGARVGETYSVPSLGGCQVIANPNGDFAAIGPTSRYILANADFSIVTTVAGALSYAPVNITQMPPGSASIWCNNQEVSTTTLAVLRTVNTAAFLPGSTLEVAKFYDRINNALIVHSTAGPYAGQWIWLFLDRHGGYRVAGPIYANQEFLEVEEMFALATAGNIITHEGDVQLEPGQAKSVVATFTDDDLLVGSEVQWNQGFLSESNSEWVNTVVARYVEPSQHWEDHAAPVLRDTDDIIADGKPREASITLRLVRYQAQALRIAEIARRKGRLWGRANVKLGPRFCELEEGDWVSWTSDRYFGGATVTFEVRSYSIDEKWQIALTLSQIAASVFADDASTGWPSDKSDVKLTPLTPPIGAPDASDWTLSATTLTSTNASVPALEITGAVPDDENASEIIVEYWKSDGVTDPTADPDTIPWTIASRYPSTTTKIDITGLAGGSDYYVALSYDVSGIPGDRLVLGPETIADLDVSGQITPLVEALPWKNTVRAKTTAALAANTYANGSSGVGATLTGNSNGALAAQDGVTLAAGERLLVANEATGSHNGIYVVTQVGDGSHPFILTRATDADSGAELVSATVKISEGTVAADQEWQCTNNASITVGTTALTFAQAGGGGSSITAKDEGSNLTTALTSLNFVGGGVVATNSGGDVTVTVNTGAGGGWSRTGTGYTAAGLWDQAVDGSVSAVTFTGLAGAIDICIVMVGVTKSVSGAPLLTVSVNNGSSFYSASGDYSFIDANGLATATTSMGQFHNTNTTFARSGIVLIQNAAVAPPVGLNVNISASPRVFQASTSPINAVQVTPSGGGNFTGGKVYCFVRA